MAATEDAGARVIAALGFLNSGNDDDMREHYIWAVKSIMTHLVPEQLATSTLVSLLAILIPEHSAHLRIRPTDGGPGPGKILRLVRGAPTSN